MTPKLFSKVNLLVNLLVKSYQIVQFLRVEIWHISIKPPLEKFRRCITGGAMSDCFEAFSWDDESSITEIRNLRETVPWVLRYLKMADENIRKFEVSVNYILGMQEAHCTCDLPQYIRCIHTRKQRMSTLLLLQSKLAKVFAQHFPWASSYGCHPHRRCAQKDELYEDAGSSVLKVPPSNDFLA